MKRTGFLLAAVLVGVLVLALLLQPKEQSWTLPDGSILRVAKVTWGTNHVYRYGHRPMDILYPLIPAKYRSNFNFQIVSVWAPPSGALVVWFKRSGIPSNAPPPPQFTGSVTNTARGRPPAPTTLPRGSVPFMVSVADDFGVESRTSSDVRVATIDSSMEVVGVVFSSYPRRAKSFSIRVHWSSPVRAASATGSMTLLGEFPVSNPASRRSLPAWTAEQLPATHRTGGLNLTLTKLETGVTVANASARLVSSFADKNRRTYSRAAFTVSENGVAATNWSISRWILSDSAGELHFLGISPTAMLKPAEVVFPDSLWMDEPAWKLNVELARTTDFSTEELCTIKGLSLPVGGFVQGTFATNLNGTEIKAAGIMRRPGTGRPAGDHLALNLQAPYSTRLCLIEVRDDQGRSVALDNAIREAEQPRSPTIAGHPLWLFQFNFPADAKTVDVTFAVSPRRNFEFHVKPTLADADAKPAK